MPVVFSGYSGVLHQYTDRHDITEILLKVALSNITLRFTASDYPFGIFKPFLQQIIDIPIVTRRACIYQRGNHPGCVVRGGVSRRGVWGPVPKG
jgi:hypothetical protein